TGQVGYLGLVWPSLGQGSQVVRIRAVFDLIGPGLLHGSQSGHCLVELPGFDQEGGEAAAQVGAVRLTPEDCFQGMNDGRPTRWPRVVTFQQQGIPNPRIQVLAGQGKVAAQDPYSASKVLLFFGPVGLPQQQAGSAANLKTVGCESAQGHDNEDNA